MHGHVIQVGKAKLRRPKISLRGSQVHLRKHFSDALLHLRNKDNESNGGVKVLCLGLLGASEDHQKGKLVPDYGKPLLEVYYDAVTVCTKGPPSHA